MSKIFIKELGLAAYISMKLKINSEDVKSENKMFVFESEKSKREWWLDYLESECYEHDEMLMALRRKL